MFLRPWFDRTLKPLPPMIYCTKMYLFYLLNASIFRCYFFPQPSMYRNAYIYFLIFYHPHTSISHNDKICIYKMLSIEMLSIQTRISRNSVYVWWNFKISYFNWYQKEVNAMNHLCACIFIANITWPHIFWNKVRFSL